MARDTVTFSFIALKNITIISFKIFTYLLPYLAVWVLVAARGSFLWPVLLYLTVR